MQRETTRLPLRLPPKRSKTYSDLPGSVCFKKQLAEVFEAFFSFVLQRKGGWSGANKETGKEKAVGN